jgi:histidinol dehydrogenase
MAIRLDTRSADFAQKFRAFLDGKRETSADVEAVVRAIVADVIARGKSTRGNSTGSISTGPGSR